MIWKKGFESGDRRAKDVRHLTRHPLSERTQSSLLLLFIFPTMETGEGASAVVATAVAVATHSGGGGQRGLAYPTLADEQADPGGRG